jgi:hypothetical protein
MRFGMRSNGIGYSKRFIYLSLGKFVLIIGYGNYGQFKDAFELENLSTGRPINDP